MDPSLKALEKTLRATSEEFVEDYFNFLRFASVSTDSSYDGETRSCAEWLREVLCAMGFTATLWETERHPIVFATHMKAGPSKPTVLLYNHYDVQPPEPLEEWQSPPFEPTIRQGQVFARGAQDNKGQCAYVLRALKLLLDRDGALPLNVKVCIEGEEEVGSGSLLALAEEKAEELKADHLIVPDFGLHAPGEPTITLGLRGITTMTVELNGASQDCHSGEHGGILYNPLRAMAELLAALYDPSGKVAVPGFYDDIEPLTLDEKEVIDFDFDAEEYGRLFGAEPVGGEKEFSPLERAWTRPALEINGLAGGYAGMGFKTVIPAKAIAKISCRLVPAQNPEKIMERVKAFLQAHTPAGMRLRIETDHGGAGVRVSPFSPVVKAVSQAYEEVFGKPCRFVLTGGSVNVVRALAHICNGSAVMMGMGLPTDNIHAPNEHFGLDRLQQGALIIVRSLELLSGE